MRISELIDKLNVLAREHGDLRVFYEDKECYFGDPLATDLEIVSAIYARRDGKDKNVLEKNEKAVLIK